MTSEPFERRWVTSGAVRLAVRDYGDRSHPTIVALHGFPESGLTWDLIARRLAAAGRRVVAPDMRGHGASSAPRSVRSYRMELLLDDVEAVISDLDVGPVEILAHDWGGALAWLLAERRPQLVTAATILNVPHPAILREAIFKNPDQRRRSRYVLKMQVPWLPERRLSRHAAAALAALFPPDHYEPAVIEEYRSNWLRPGVARGMLNWYRSAARDRSLRIPETPVDLPIDIVWGQGDPLFELDLAEQSRALGPNISLSYLACGHAPHRELPDRVISMVLGAST